MKIVTRAKCVYGVCLLLLGCSGREDRFVYTQPLPSPQIGLLSHYYSSRASAYEAKRKSLTPDEMRVLQFAEEDIKKNSKWPVKFLYVAIAKQVPYWEIIIEHIDGDAPGSTISVLIVSDDGKYIRYLSAV